MTRYQAGSHLGWDRPNLVGARDDIVELFAGRLGYQHVTDLGLDPTSDQLTRHLRDFCRSSERRPDDILAVYIAGHGEILDDTGEHVLLMSDTDPEDIDDALLTATLARKMLRGTSIRRLLLMLDTCYSGQGGNEFVAATLTRAGNGWRHEFGTGLAVLTSAYPHQQAETGAFPRVLAHAVDSLATAGHGPTTLDIDALVGRMNDDPSLPPHQHINANLARMSGEAPPFFPNPRHDARLTEVDLALQQAIQWEEQRERRETELRTRFLVRAMGATPDRAGWWFSGRHRALAEITSWLRVGGAETSPVLAVTAGPGSGKTAVLGLVAALTDEEHRRIIPLDTIGTATADLPAPGDLDVSVYAQHLTDEQVLQGLAEAARVPATTVGELAEGLRREAAGRTFTVLIDALDEAMTPDTLCGRVLLPLIRQTGVPVRFLLGTRPHLLPTLGLRREDQIDLDADRYADPDALLRYTVLNLLQAHPGSPYLNCPQELRMSVARRVAAAAGPSFLVARISAGTLAATPVLPDPDDPAWRAALPRLPSEAMRHDMAERLGSDADRAVDLLRPLAFTEGQGLPWEDLWASLASALSGRVYTDDDIMWLRHAAGAYVVEATESGRSAYRLYHEALAEHLRADVDATEAHARVTHALISRVPRALDGERDWSRAHPYTRRYLPAHAVRGEVLDEVVTEAEFLVHADPDELMSHLREVRSGPAYRAAEIYRTSFGAHRHEDSSERRRILALDAAHHDDPALLATLNSGIDEHAWKPVWSSGGTLSAGLRAILAHKTGRVRSVACGKVNGQDVVAVGYGDTTVRLWNLVTGRRIDDLHTGHLGAVMAMYCTDLAGRPVLVTGSGDCTLRLWDLATGRPIGDPLTGHEAPVTAVSCTELGGRAMAVSSSADGTARVWDLATGRQIGDPLDDHAGSVRGVACTVIDGHPAAVTAAGRRTLHVWRLGLDKHTHQAAITHHSQINILTCTEQSGRPTVVTCSGDRTVQAWDLTDRRMYGELQTGHAASVNALACAVLDGHLVAVTGSDDRTVKVWDLSTREQLGKTMYGHTREVTAAACATVNSGLVAVTGSDDRSIRTWELTTAGKRVGNGGHDAIATAVACTELNGRQVSVTAHDSPVLRRWDVATGQPLAPLRTGHTGAVTSLVCTELAGRPVVVTGSTDLTVGVWDAATGQAALPPARGHEDRVTAVACMSLNDRPVIVSAAADGTARAWDLNRGELLGPPVIVHVGPEDLGLRTPLTAVACGVLHGRPVGIVGSRRGDIRVWDLTTGEPPVLPTGERAPRRPFHWMSSAHGVRTMAFVARGSSPVVVTGNSSGRLSVWDLSSLRAGTPLTGHLADSHPLAAPPLRTASPRIVTAVATTTLDGRPVAATCSSDETVRLWDLNTYRTLDAVPTPDACHALTFAETGHLVCCYGDQITVLRQAVQ
ncbi:caspase family protein [Streptomyces sp. NPDC007983]|uniref:caspase family protein n=1 Tax=Streptomyces sp. NPDC007983 TaxID=3364800 RepID=UPI0036EED1D3